MNSDVEQLPVLKILNLCFSNEEKIYEDLRRGKFIMGVTQQYTASQIKQYPKWVIVPKNSIAGFSGSVTIIKSEFGSTEYKFRPLKAISISTPQRDYKTGMLWVDHSAVNDLWV